MSEHVVYYVPMFPKSASGLTAREERRQRKAVEDALRLSVYRQVDLRDQGHCRVCGKRCDPYTVDSLNRGEHHHILFRSLGGQDSTDNLCLLCWRCHEAVHRHGTLKLEGDADVRDERGRLTGICVKRPGDGVWVIERWV